MKFLPSDDKELYNELGINHPDELFLSIPPDVIKEKIDFNEPGQDEWELKNQIKEYVKETFHGKSFLGFGLYHHQIPDVVDHLSGIRNFVTSYTPYQAEVAQGTLQALFEYQSLMAELTSMDLANASLYDGATAMMESIRMALRSVTLKKAHSHIYISKGVHPYYIDVLNTYFSHDVIAELNITIHLVDLNKITGATDWQTYISNIKTSDTAEPENHIVVYQNPNWVGVIEPPVSEKLLTNENSQILFGVNEALSLSALPSPADAGACIVWGEGQSLGMPVSFGGPGLGFIACKKSYMRQIPGRLVGKTNAQNSTGDDYNAFVITLATREQHIRREKATSNICSNQTLMAIRAAIYMSAVGWSGMQKAALKCKNNTAYFLNGLQKRNVELLYSDAVYFHEIAYIVPNREEFILVCIENNLFPGHSFTENDSGKQCILTNLTEVHNTEDIDELLNLIDKHLSS